MCGCHSSWTFKKCLLGSDASIAGHSHVIIMGNAVFVPSNQVRIAVVDAIGFAVHLCAADALNEQLPKLIPGVVQLFKKHTEQYHISQVGDRGDERKGAVPYLSSSLLYDFGLVC